MIYLVHIRERITGRKKKVSVAGVESVQDAVAFAKQQLGDRVSAVMALVTAGEPENLEGESA